MNRLDICSKCEYMNLNVARSYVCRKRRYEMWPLVENSMHDFERQQLFDTQEIEHEAFIVPDGCDFKLEQTVLE